jgi:hypothetical protein
MYLWIEIFLELSDKISKTETYRKHNLALVDYGVQRISHLMRNRRIYQTKEFSLSFRCVIKNLLGDIDEADHSPLLSTLKTFYQTFLNLEELELRDVLFIDASHAR